jgi:response regulator RpfG family c-di-GMP phosphodiesterase
MERKYSVLFVDDEKHILASMERIFRKEGLDVLLAPGGAEGLELLASRPVSLVISDHRMPGMSGAEFLQRVRELYPDTLRIMLTGYADTNAAVAAINEGQVYRFITKPWNDHELRQAVHEALQRWELVEENRRLFELTQRQNAELLDLNQNLEHKVEERTSEIQDKKRELEGLYKRLERNFFESVRVFQQLIEMFDPVLGGHSKRVAALSRIVAGGLGLAEAEQELVEIAGLLHDIGLIGLPREVLTKRAAEMSPSEAALYQQHPVLGYTALSGIDNLQQVAVVIKTHHESFGGGGFPDGLQGEEIPLGGRIIHAASLYDDLLRQAKLQGAQALKELERRSGSQLDPEVVFHLDAALQNVGPSRGREAACPLSQLRPGMVLSRNLKTLGGLLLLPERAVIQEAHIEKILNFSKIDPIAGGIFICLPDA